MEGGCIGKQSHDLLTILSIASKKQEHVKSMSLTIRLRSFGESLRPFLMVTCKVLIVTEGHRSEVDMLRRRQPTKG